MDEQKCNGPNCTATASDQNHSAECREAHEMSSDFSDYIGDGQEVLERIIAQNPTRISQHPIIEGMMIRTNADGSTEIGCLDDRGNFIPNLLSVPPKPFRAPGAWFPVDSRGRPMREYAPKKWESAHWPSDAASVPEFHKGIKE